MAQMWRVHLQYSWSRFNPRVRKIPWRRAWEPTPVFLSGESHGQRSLVGYSPWGCRESDMTEWLTHALELEPERALKIPYCCYNATVQQHILPLVSTGNLNTNLVVSHRLLGVCATSPRLIFTFYLKSFFLNQIKSISCNEELRLYSIMKAWISLLNSGKI